MAHHCDAEAIGGRCLWCADHSRVGLGRICGRAEMGAGVLFRRRDLRATRPGRACHPDPTLVVAGGEGGQVLRARPGDLHRPGPGRAWESPWGALRPPVYRRRSGWGDYRCQPCHYGFPVLCPHPGHPLPSRVVGVRGLLYGRGPRVRARGSSRYRRETIGWVARWACLRW